MEPGEAGLNPLLLDGLRDMGITKFTPIQEQAIPEILSGKDLIACSQTGTGKTIAYILPIMNKIMSVKREKHNIRALVLAPTRELAQQIDIQVQGLGYYSGVSSIPVYGGSSATDWDKQAKALREGADIVIASPGRIINYIALGIVDLEQLDFFILDEADRMLEMGFIDDIQKIISYLPKNRDRQNLLFSATMSPEIRNLAKQLFKNPVELQIGDIQPAIGINQQAYKVYQKNKPQLLKYILNKEEVTSVLVFCGKKDGVNELVRTLNNMNLEVAGIHSGKEQAEREQILRDFKNNKYKALIATDILARGIDIIEVSHVINYDVPSDPEDYIHRIGRTARAEKKGTSITFISERDQEKFIRIEKKLSIPVNKLNSPEEIGPEPDFKQESGSHKYYRSNKSKGQYNKPKGKFRSNR